MGDAGQQEYSGYQGWDNQAGWGQGGYHQYPGYTDNATSWAQPAYQPSADQAEPEPEPEPPGEERPASQNGSGPGPELPPPPGVGQPEAPPEYYYASQEQHQAYSPAPQANGYPPTYHNYPYPPAQPAYDYGQAQAPGYQPQQSGQADTGAAYPGSSQYNSYSGYYSQPAYDAQQGYQQPAYNYAPQPPQQYDYSQWPNYASATPVDATAGAPGNGQDGGSQAYGAASGYAQEQPPAAGANGPMASYASVVAQGQAASLGVTPDQALALATHVWQQRGQHAPQDAQAQAPQQQAQPPSFTQAAQQQQQGVKEWTWTTGKMQIPTNPRLAGSFVGMQKPLPREPAAAQPAYVKVDAQPAQEGKAGGPGKTSEFPAALRAYVQRCFERCKTDEQRKGVEQALQEIIRTATREGTLSSTDWDTRPFPTVLSSPALTQAGPSERRSRWGAEPPASSPDAENRSRWGAEKEGQSNGHSALFSRLGLKKSKNMTWVRGQSPDRGTKPKASPRGRKRGRKAPAAAEPEDSRGSTSGESGGETPHKKGSGKPTVEEVNRRERRSRRFEGANGKKGGRRGEPVAGEASLRKDRAALLLATAGQGAAEDIDWSTMTVKGTSQTVEKRFLRLTAAPDPSTVRPEPVLHRALALVEGTDKDYYYRCDQLKSMRQDLTVQRIRNAFTVRVYETHARMALEFGDLAEFAQCQAQLKILYAEGLPGCVHEFAAYRLLYLAFHHTAGSADLLAELRSLSAEVKASHPVAHALKIRAAYSAHDYVSFFRLYDSAPNLNKRLLDLRVEKVRFAAVQRMTKAFRPHLHVAEVARVLGFAAATGPTTEVTPEEVDDCQEWLAAHGATVVSDKGDLLLDTKVSQSSLFIPVPAEAVAHGDANLAAEAFFAKRTLV